MHATGSKAPRQGFRLIPRFSLRIFLLSVTAFAIGFPIWYRWPYQELELRYPIYKGKPDRTKPPAGRVITTWRRNWGGTREKHGPRTTFSFSWDGKRVEHFEHDVLHGPYVQSAKGMVTGTGQYYRGELDGVLIERATAEKGQDTSNWRRGILHGLWDRDFPESNIREKYFFVDGRLTHYMDKPIGSRLLTQIQQGEIKPGQLADAINATDISKLAVTVDGSLSTFCEALEEQLKIPVTIDSPINGSEINVSFPMQGVDFPTALILSTLGHGLDWECRGGGLAVVPRGSQSP